MADSSFLAKPQQFNAFSGANIFATIGNKLIGNLQAVTASITRETAAIYSFADANPKTFVKGKRGIAGTLVFSQFDRHALLQEIFKEAFNQPFNTTDPNATQLFQSNFQDVNSGNNLFSAQSVITRNFNQNVGLNSALAFTGEQLGGTLRQQIQAVYALVGNQRLRYSDQIPAFDLTLNFVNEAGDASFCVIGGMVIVNEGWGYTLDDMTSEVACTYVARYITPLTSLTDQNPPVAGANLAGGNAAFSTAT